MLQNYDSLRYDRLRIGQTNATETLKKQTFFSRNLLNNKRFQISSERIDCFLLALSNKAITSHNFMFITLSAVQFPEALATFQVLRNHR